MPPAKTRRLPSARWIVLGSLACFSALVLPFAHMEHRLQASLSLPTLTLAAAFCALTAFLLLQLFRISGQTRALGTATAFTFAAASLFVYRIVISEDRSGVATHTHAPALWAWWHIGFALIFTASFLVPNVASTYIWSTQSRRRLGYTCVGSAFIVSVVGAIVIVHSRYLHDQRFLQLEMMPEWVVNGVLRVCTSLGMTTHASELFLGVGMTIAHLTLVGSALFFSLARMRSRMGPEAWMPIAAASVFFDSALSLYSNSVLTIGWYAGETLTLATSAIVLIAILAEFVALYRKSESDKEYLEYQAITLLQATRDATESEQRIRRIIKNAADPYIEINFEGNIQAWNEKAQELFGLGNAALGAPLAESIMSKEGAPELADLIHGFWSDEERFDGVRAELLARDTNGEEFPLEAAMWVDESGDAPQMSFFFRDISLRKQAEERLQVALREEREAFLRMQEVDRAKSNFVSSISHELRSPLTNTIGYLELLHDGGAGELTEAQHHMIEIAQRNANRLFKLIEDLLTQSRIENGSFHIRHHAVELGDVIRSAVNTFQPLAHERNISLTFESGFELGACPADREQIERALSCVISNAVKFTPVGGRVDVVAESHADTIAIVVTDNGIGIPLEEQAQLFKRFFRASVAIEQQHQGAGLGLTIARAIIERHNGEIFVESELGKGTSVTIILPALHVFSSETQEQDNQDTVDQSPFFE